MTPLHRTFSRLSDPRINRKENCTEHIEKGQRKRKPQSQKAQGCMGQRLFDQTNQFLMR